MAISSWSAGAKAQDSTKGICFPAEIDELQAVQFPQEKLEELRGYRNTQIAGYNAAEFNTAITVYIYDKKPVEDLAQEFRASGSEIFAVHKGTESPMAGPVKLAIAGKQTDGLLGIFLWSEGETDFGSFLWLGEVSDKYVKIRTTYIRPEQDDQTASAMRFAMTAMHKVADHICIPDSSDPDDASMSASPSGN